MKNKDGPLIVAALILISVGVWFLFRSSQNSPEPKISSYNQEYANLSGEEPAEKISCDTEVIKVKMRDNYLRGVARRGEELEVKKGFYNCNGFLKGDLAWVKSPSDSTPVVRYIRAIPGDRIEVVENKERRRWNIKINGEYLKYRSELYFFGRTEDKPAIRGRNDSLNFELGDEEILLFSEIPPGLHDSGEWGVFPASKLLGKVEL